MAWGLMGAWVQDTFDNVVTENVSIVHIPEPRIASLHQNSHKITLELYEMELLLIGIPGNYLNFKPFKICSAWIWTDIGKCFEFQ